MPPSGKVWVVVKNGTLGINCDYYCGGGEWCNNLKHAVQFFSESAASLYMTNTFIVADGVHVEWRTVTNEY